MLLTKHIQTKFFELVAQAASELQMPAFVIGGYVRDILLDRKSKDIDIVALGSGIELAQVIASKLTEKKEVKFYGQFGTAMIRYKDIEIEFVGARKESYNTNSRKPIVENGTLIDDQNRRDFTINAMAISLQKENFGELIDPFDGVSDLENKIIRTPLCPDITYSDDPLRMMRAIRFATQLDFTIENKSFEAIKRNKERIKIVSMERITDELNKIIAAPKPSIGFKLLFDSGLLKIIFPQMTALQGVDVVNGKGHKDNFYHTLEVLDNLSIHSDDLWLRWAAILHDIAKPQTKRFEENHGWTFHSHEFRGAKMIPGIFKMLRLPLNDKMKFVQKMVLLHLRPIVLAQEEVTDSAVRRLLFDAGEDIDALMLLCDADITSKNEYKIQKYRENFQLVRRKLKEIEEKDNFRNWQPPINGEMIMQAFEIQQGHEVGIIKHAIREAILDGMIENNFEDAYQFMEKIGKKELQLTIKNEIQKPIEINHTPIPSKNT
ncbi:MAG: CCA tRNA nucleotidyltransferase [Lentimicrobiaceae bacterium]|jgi:putative nucleotidyltransferase with HDIG domain|nr:CCA tRNA nucleotidyltransferase [Lentimicrobiaceae bacterium]